MYIYTHTHIYIYISPTENYMWSSLFFNNFVILSIITVPDTVLLNE